ncbi:MAG TPA: FG-GAP-like repeat-containing protein [Candidatus Kapabacteria bacterium]|nr:FG-GAP-like repeat-containing protein [Candidatus Kapabacteria bacterium]
MNIVPNGEWHDYRRDDSRAGVQPLEINPPPSPSLKRGGGLEERWSIRLGGSFQEIEPVGDGSGDLLMADGGGIQRVSVDGQFRWRTKPFGAHWIAFVCDLDSDGAFEILTSNGREVIILSADSGEILFRDSVGAPFAYGTYATMFNVHSFFAHPPPASSPFIGGGVGMQILVPVFSSKEVLMYDCAGGARNTRILHRLWMPDGYHPTIAIGDVNNDGVDEIVIARIGGVYVFDPASGNMISQTIWKSDEERRRNYGHFELADVNGDGNLEAIILSDRVSRHIAVLGNDGNGNFHPLWDRFIEHIYPTDTTELRYTSNSIRDFDGDGKLEIAVSIFNESKDNRWHTHLLRAETGESILDLPDRYLRGVQDVNIDGMPELCLSCEKARGPRHYSKLSIYSPIERKTIWELGEGHFAGRSVHTQGTSSEFKPDVFGAQGIWNGEFGGKPGIFIQSPEAGLQRLDRDLALSRVGDGTNGSDRTDRSYRVAHIAKDSLYLTEANGDITRLTAAGPQHFLSCGYHLTTEAHIAARPGSMATVAFWNGVRYLAVSDFANHVHLFKNDASGQPKPITKLCCRSRIGYDGVFHAASIIITRNGPRLVVVDDEGLPHSRISLYSLEGERMQSYEFPEMPPSSPGNRIGCYDWLLFEHSRGEALFASFYQSYSMNSECSLAFLIETGEILWRNERTGEGEFGRGVGPWGTSSLLRNGGHPIATFCAKDTLCLLDLETGQFERVPKLITEYTADEMKHENRLKEQTISTAASADDPFTAYGTPIVRENDLVIAGCLGGMGILNRTGLPKWWHVASFGDILYRLPGIGDVDGDSKLELGQGHADGTFRIYDYETSKLRATLDLNSISTDVLTLDANGDGKMEFVIGTNDGRLLLIGHAGNDFAILEQYETGAAMGSPIAADFDGDGRSEIFVVTGDGNLRCFV